YNIVFWRSWPGTVVLSAAAIAHTALGIWALYERRQFRWTSVEITQLVLGLSIPALLISHLVGVRFAASLFGHEKYYEQVLFGYWIARPYMATIQYVVLLVSWVHGCIGLYFWLRMKPWFRRTAPVLLAVAVLLPAVSMLGLYQGGRAIVDASDDADWRIENLARRHVGTPQDQVAIDKISDTAL